MDSQEEGSPHPGRLERTPPARAWSPARFRSPFDGLRVSGSRYVAELMDRRTNAAPSRAWLPSGRVPSVEDLREDGQEEQASGEDEHDDKGDNFGDAPE